GVDLPKIEAVKLALEALGFGVRRVSDAVLDTLSLGASRRGVELVGFVDDAVPARLHGDPGRLRQVLMNLTSNALKFTPHGEVVIRVERDPDPQDGEPRSVMLRVSV